MIKQFEFTLNITLPGHCVDHAFTLLKEMMVDSPDLLLEGADINYKELGKVIPFSPETNIEA